MEDNKYIHMHIICGIIIIHMYIHRLEKIMGDLKKKPDQKIDKGNPVGTPPVPDRLSSDEQTIAQLREYLKLFVEKQKEKQKEAQKEEE